MARNKSKNDALRFTALDFLIIALALLCIVGIYFREEIAGIFITPANVDVEIRFAVKDVDKGVAALVEENDVWYYNGYELATIGKFSEESSNVVLNTDSDNDGILDLAVSDDQVTLTGTMFVIGQYNDRGLFVTDNRYYVTVGNVLKIDGPGYSLNVIITEIPRK